MLTFKSGFAESFMGQILELSAQAQIERRNMEKSSAAYEKTSGAILAYGNVLALLTALRALEDIEVTLGQTDIRDCAMAMPN